MLLIHIRNLLKWLISKEYLSNFRPIGPVDTLINKANPIFRKPKLSEQEQGHV